MIRTQPRQGTSRVNGGLLRLYPASARNLLIGGDPSGLMLLAKPGAMVAYAAESLFAFRPIPDRRGIAQKNEFEVLPAAGRSQINLYNTNGETWFRNSASYVTDVVSLCLLCQAIKPKVIFEMGTLTGYTTAHMVLICGECVIYTLDLPLARSPLWRAPRLTVCAEMHGTTKRYVWERLEAATKIRTLVGDSATFDYSPYHGCVVFFFIGGSHSYDYVRSDTCSALKRDREV